MKEKQIHRHFIAVPLFLSALTLIAAIHVSFFNPTDQARTFASIIHANTEQAIQLSLGASILARPGTALRQSESEFIQGEGVIVSDTLTRFSLPARRSLFLLSGAAWVRVLDDSTMIVALDSPVLTCSDVGTQCTIVPRGYQGVFRPDTVVGSLKPVPDFWLLEQLSKLSDEKVQSDVQAAFHSLPKDIQLAFNTQDDAQLFSAWNAVQSHIDADGHRALLSLALARPSTAPDHTRLIASLARTIEPHAPIDILTILALARNRSLRSGDPILTRIDTNGIASDSLSLAVSAEAANEPGRLPDELIRFWENQTKFALSTTDADVTFLLSPVVKLVSLLGEKGFPASSDLWNAALHNTRQFASAVLPQDKRSALASLFSSHNADPQSNTSSSSIVYNDQSLVSTAKSLVEDAGLLFTVNSSFTQVSPTTVRVSDMFFNNTIFNFDLNVLTSIASSISVNGVPAPNEVPLSRLTQ